MSYVVVFAVAAEVGATMVRLWLNNFGLADKQRVEEKLQRFYLRNPAGGGQIALLRENASGEDVGIQTIVSRRFFANGRAYRAGNLADYAVDVAHRSLGPALQLMQASIAHSKTDFAFLYGLPNRKSLSVLRRAGMEPVLNMARYVAPLRSRYYLENKMPAGALGIAAWFTDHWLSLAGRLKKWCYGLSIDWIEGSTATAAIEAIWSDAVRSGFVLSERSADVLRWRYEVLLNSGWRFDVARGHRDGAVLGYAVWALHGEVAVISDFLCAHPARQTLPLMVAFQNRARGLGANAVSLEYGGGPEIHKALLKAGFFLREGYPLYMFGNDNVPASDRWYFTSFDRDND